MQHSTHTHIHNLNQIYEYMGDFNPCAQLSHAFCASDRLKMPQNRDGKSRQSEMEMESESTSAGANCKCIYKSRQMSTKNRQNISLICMQLRLNNVAPKRLCVCVPVCVQVCVCVYNLVQANQIGSQFGWGTVVVVVAVATCKICNCYENVSSASREVFAVFLLFFYRCLARRCLSSYQFNGSCQLEF